MSSWTLFEPLEVEEAEVDKADTEGYNNQDTEHVSDWDFGKQESVTTSLEARSYSSSRDGLGSWGQGAAGSKDDFRSSKKALGTSVLALLSVDENPKQVTEATTTCL